MARESRSRTSKPIRGLFQLLKPLILQLPGLCSAACFTSNGTNVNTLIGYPDDGIYAPCKNTTNGASMCCATGIYRGSRDNCYEDGSGLCYNKNVGPTVHFWRESCTDPTWRDPACVKLFNNIPGGLYWNDVELKKCNDGSYCNLGPGDENATACCAAGEGYFVNVVNGKVQVDPATRAMTSSSTSATSPTSTSSGGLPSTTIPIPSQLGNNTTGLSTGAKAGIAVGVIVVALAALALIGWLIVSKKKAKTKATPIERPKSPDGPKELPQNEVYRNPVELEQPGGGFLGPQYSHKKLSPELEGDLP